MSVEEMQHSIFVATMGQMKIPTLRITPDDRNITYHFKS